MANASYFTKMEVGVSLFLGLLHAYLVKKFYAIASEPYMDEIFHIKQTRQYCEGNYYDWDDKITTPPALYVLAVPFFCDSERYLNSAIFPICFLGLCALRRRLKNAKNSNLSTLLTCTNLVLLPVLFDTSILFYTDLLSLTTIIWGFNFYANPFLSALCFTIGVLTRQTNIVWAGMFCVVFWWENLDRRNPIRSTMRAVLRAWPFAVLGAAFISFIFINDGIVLGDKGAHRPVFHAAQFLYFLGFVSFSSMPIFLSHISKPKFWRFMLTKPLIIFIIICIFAIVIRFYTFSHPYLLADNRHFPFYFWRRVLSKKLFRFLLIPLYLVSLFYMLRAVYFPSHFLFFFILCTCVCIIPAHLIEFRYFMVPYTLWRLAVTESKSSILFIELLWSISINTIALYLFFYRPFIWSHDSSGAIQRFMW